MADQIEVLDKTYENLGDSIEKAFSKDASNLIGQQNQLLEQQKVLIQQQMKEEEDKKKTDNDRIKEWKEQIEEIDKTIADNKEKAKDAIFGEDLKSAINDFAQAYADAWTSGDDRAKASKDLVKNMIRQMIVEAMKTDVSKPMELIREKLLDFWSDGYISDSEESIIDQMVENMTHDLDNKYAWADKYLKGEEDTEEDVSDNSLKGAYAKASQESIDLLAGQTGAMRVVMEDVRNTIQPIREQMQFISNLQRQGWEDVRVIKDLTTKVDRNTEQVANNTKMIHEVAGKISENTRSTVNALEGTLNVKVKM